MATTLAGPSTSSSSPFSNNGSSIPSSPPDSPTNNRRSTSSSHLAVSSTSNSTTPQGSRKNYGGSWSKRRSGGFLLEPRSRNNHHHGNPFGGGDGGSNASDRSHSPGSTRALSGTTRVVSDASSQSSAAVNAFFRSAGKGKARPNSLRAEDERLKELLARTIEGDTARIVELAGAISGAGENTPGGKKNRKSLGTDEATGETGRERRMTATPSGTNSPAPGGWADIRQNGGSTVPGFFSTQVDQTPQARKPSGTPIPPDTATASSPAARHKSVASPPQPAAPQFKISDHTWHRAQRAAQYIGLMAQYRTMLSNQPPLFGVWDGGNNGRKYNPLQAIRNRRLRRNKLRLPQLDETPWEDERSVANWVESFPDYNSRHNKGNFYEEYLRHRPGPPGSDDKDVDEDALGLGAAAAAAAAPRRPRRNRTDWYVTPQELFADNYWAEENQVLLEDRSGNKIYPNPTSPVMLQMPEFPRISKEHPHHHHNHLHKQNPHSRKSSLHNGSSSHHHHLHQNHHHQDGTPEKLAIIKDVEGKCIIEETEGGFRKRLKGKKHKHNHHHDHSSSDELEYSEEDSDVPGPEKTFLNRNFPRRPSPPPHHHSRHSLEQVRSLKKAQAAMLDDLEKQEVSSPPPSDQKESQVSGFSWNTSHRRSESPEKASSRVASVSSTAAAPFKSAARKIQQTATAIPGKKGRTQSMDVTSLANANESPGSKHKRSITAFNALLKSDGTIDSSDVMTPRAGSGTGPSFNVLLSPPLESDMSGTSAAPSAAPSTNASRVPSARTSLDESRGRERKRDSITQEFFNTLRRRQSPTKSPGPPKNVSSVKVDEVGKVMELGRSSSSLDLKNMTDTTDESPQQKEAKSSKFGTVKKLRSGAGRVGELVRNEVAGVGDFLLGNSGDKNAKADSASSASSPASSSDEGVGLRKRMSVFGRKKPPKQAGAVVVDGNASTDPDDSEDDRAAKKLEKRDSNLSTSGGSSSKRKFLYRLPRMPSAHGHGGMGSAPPSPLRESTSFDEERPVLLQNGNGDDIIAMQHKVRKSERRPSRFSRLAPPEIETFRDSSRDRSPARGVVIETMDQKARRLEEERRRNEVAVMSASSGSLPSAIPAHILSSDGDETPRDPNRPVPRNNSVGTMALQIGAAATYDRPKCRKAVLRVRAGIISTGVLSRGITSTTPRMNISTALYPVFCRPEGGSAVIARVVNRTSTISAAIKSTTSALLSAQNEYANRTLPGYMGTLEGLRRDIDLDWYPCVQRMADEADGVNAAVTAGDTLEVKRITIMADKLIRKRGKGMKWVRRWGFMFLEWTVLGFMWLAWIVVMFIRACRFIVGGAFKGVRWFLWLP